MIKKHTQGMKVHIKRQTLLSVVTIITAEGARLVTTMSRSVQKNDARIQKLKRQMVHLQAPKVMS